MITENKNGLIGKWFYTFNQNRKIKWVGQILSEVNPGFYLIQLYNNLGSRINQHIVQIESMRGWVFFSSLDEMKQAVSLEIYWHKAEAKNREGQKNE
jgi:hypothetical protein